MSNIISFSDSKSIFDFDIKTKYKNELNLGIL